LEKGNANTAASLLEQLPSHYDPDGAATAARIALFLSQNNTTAARAALERCKLEELVGGTGALLPQSYFDGQIARAENDATKMRTAFSTAREKVESKLRAEPDNGLWHGVLCVVEAGLGLKTEAINAGQKAVSLLPVTKDAVDGPVAEAYLAMGYAWLGEKDSAIELLTNLATRPGGPAYGELLLDPAWRDVRSDPRFQQMLVKLKPAHR
jgi:predicted Zn-dependent protease